MTDGQARAQAVLDGGMAALARKPRTDNSHPAGTCEHFAWADGYEEISSPAAIRKMHRCVDGCGSRVLKEGSRCRPCHILSMKGREVTAIPPRIVDPAEKAAECCDALLRRQLQTGLHWITDPARFRVACESVGLIG